MNHTGCTFLKTRLSTDPCRIIQDLGLDPNCSLVFGRYKCIRIANCGYGIPVSRSLGSWYQAVYNKWHAVRRRGIHTEPGNCNWTNDGRSHTDDGQSRIESCLLFRDRDRRRLLSPIACPGSSVGSSSECFCG